MPSELIKIQLVELKSQNKFDADFIDMLAEANQEDEDGETTVTKILKLIKERYAEDKKNKT